MWLNFTNQKKDFSVHNPASLMSFSCVVNIDPRCLVQDDRTVTLLLLMPTILQGYFTTG